jgi:hypothetical protein
MIDILANSADNIKTGMSTTRKLMKGLRSISPPWPPPSAIIGFRATDPIIIHPQISSTDIL